MPGTVSVGHGPKRGVKMSRICRLVSEWSRVAVPSGWVHLDSERVYQLGRFRVRRD